MIEIGLITLIVLVAIISIYIARKLIKWEKEIIDHTNANHLRRMTYYEKMRKNENKI